MSDSANENDSSQGAVDDPQESAYSSSKAQDTSRNSKQFLTHLYTSDQVHSYSGDNTNKLMPLLCRQQVIDILTKKGIDHGIGMFVLYRMLNVVLKRLWRDW